VTGPSIGFNKIGSFSPYFPDELWFSACQLRRNPGIPGVSDHSLPT
jgi:hypothetical protein